MVLTAPMVITTGTASSSVTYITQSFEPPDPPPLAGVREPRRPLPAPPSDSVAIQL